MRRTWALVAITGGGLLIGCGHDGDTGNGTPSGPLRSNDTLSDGQIVGIAETINNSEVDQANAALAKLTSTDAASYARRMASEHGSALNQLSDLMGVQGIAIEESATRADLVTTNQAAVTQLNDFASGGTYDRLYTHIQVEGHRSALTITDAELMPSVENAALETTLLDLRAQLIAHMREAEAILADLP